jgi:hypothetical protein
MLASYQLLVRNTFVGGVLNGKRIPRKRKPLVEAPSAITSSSPSPGSA